MFQSCPKHQSSAKLLNYPRSNIRTQYQTILHTLLHQLAAIRIVARIVSYWNSHSSKKNEKIFFKVNLAVQYDAIITKQWQEAIIDDRI